MGSSQGSEGSSGDVSIPEEDELPLGSSSDAGLSVMSSDQSFQMSEINKICPRSNEPGSKFILRGIYRDCVESLLKGC